MCNLPRRITAVFVCLLQSISLLAIPALTLAQAIPGKNVDMVGPTPPNTGQAGNVLMQQNEVAGATSLWKPNVQYAAFNDYRLVDRGGDAVIGFAYSTDYGRTWFSFAHPGFSVDDPGLPPGGADANIVVLPGRSGGGLVLVNHMAFWRDESQPAMLRTGVWYEHNRDSGPPASFLFNSINTTGNASHFHDKPSFEGMLRDPAEGLNDIVLTIPPFDGPDNSGASHDGYDLAVPAARIHTCFTKFVGNADGTKVECQFTDDLINWSHEVKISESVEINQGTAIALQDFSMTVNVFWSRFEDNNETAAIMYAKSTDGGVSFSKAQVITEFCPYNAPTGVARFRSNALPAAVATGDDPADLAVFFSSRNDAGEPCNIRGKGNKPDEIGFSNVRMDDDFDGSDEDGVVRTSRNFARILMARPGQGNQWTVEPVDRQEWTSDDNVEGCSSGDHCRKNFHQIMPACEAARGIITCTWFDTRLDRLNNLASPITSGFIEDAILHLEDTDNPPDGTLETGTVIPAELYGLVPPPTVLPPTVNNYPLRRNLDLFAAQVEGGVVRQYTVDPDTWYPAAGGVPSDSVRVSRFATRATLTNDPDNPVKRQQLEFNFGNARLFQKGKAPFLADYNSVWALSAKQEAEVNEDGDIISLTWVPNHGAPNTTDLFASAEPVFNVGWTSNHMVRGRVFYTGCDTWDESLQMWVAGEGCASEIALPEMPDALMPLVGEDSSDDFLACTAGPGGTGALTRNQTVMYAGLRPDISAEVVSAIKTPAGMINTFVVSISNGTKTDRTVTLSLPESTSLMSFDKTLSGADALTDIVVNVPRGSSNARTVFDFANVGEGPLSVILTVSDSDTNEVLARITLGRDTLVPLENVHSGLQCTVIDGEEVCSAIDVVDQEFYDLILSRGISTTQYLDLQNLDFQNLDFENTPALLDFQNLDFQNLDLENNYVFLDFQNLDFQNLDFQNLDFQNLWYANLDLQNAEVENLDLQNSAGQYSMLYLDLENLDFENSVLENLDFQNLDFQNLDFQNLDFQNLDFQNLDFQNSTTYASDIENLDFQNLDFQNVTPGDSYKEISWTADSANNTTTGVDIQPIFSSPLATALENSGTTVLLTVRQAYLTPTVATVTGDPQNPFCTPQVVAQNQVVYAAVLSPEDFIYDGSVEDPSPVLPDTPGFVTTPDGSYIITYRFINPPADFDLDELNRNSGISLFTQAGDTVDCDSELGGNEQLDACELDFEEPDVTPPVISGLPSDPPPGSPFSLGPDNTTYHLEVSGISALDDTDGPIDVECTPGTHADPDLNPITYSWDFNVGSTTVTCTATDAADNTATVSFTAEVVDDTPPVITPPADVTVEATGPQTTVAIGTATATDAFEVTIANNAPATFPLGTTVVTWTATDANGNSATATQNVIVVDTTGPEITLNSNSLTVVTAGSTANVMAAQLEANVTSAFDLVDGNVPVTCQPVGGLTIGLHVDAASCTATDQSSNSTTVSFDIKVDFAFNVVITAPNGKKNSGSAIPIDFYYTNSSGTKVDSSAIAVSAAWDGPFTGQNCQGSSTGAGSGVSTGSSGFRYSASQKKWQFTWATPPIPGSYKFSVFPPGPGPSTICVSLK